MSGMIEDNSPIRGQIRGWCPGALRPMETGDGLVLRIRPHGGRLSVLQAQALADLAAAHGNGLIDLGSRAHLQLRGIHENALPRLHDALAELKLLDPDPEVEARRNILTSPLSSPDDPTAAILSALESALRHGPDLPAKFGFAVDCGRAAVLGASSADIRIERAETGLILRAEGMRLGQRIAPADAAAAALDLARWFAANRGPHRRMARLLESGILPPLRPEAAALTEAPPGPGLHPQGLFLALPFGQISAEALRRIATTPLILTPWRMLFMPGLQAEPMAHGLIASPEDPLLRVAACTGAPGCASASVQTRSLARGLAPLVPKGCLLHVSGCAKGCAHAGNAAEPADLTLTGRDGRFDLIVRAAADAPPRLTGLSPDLIPARFPALLREHLAP